MIFDVSDISLTSLTSPTCFIIHSIRCHSWKALCLSFPKLFQINNLLNNKEVMSKNIFDNNNAALLLMAHVEDVGDVKYLNKRSKVTLYRAMLLISLVRDIRDISMLCNYCIEIFHIFELHCVS